MTEEMLDVRGSLRMLRRFWRTVAMVTLLGLVGAVVYGLTQPPSYTAKALVLLPGAVSSSSSSGSQTGNTITTDAQIATSSLVLVPAGKKVDPSLSLSTLQHRVSTSASSDATILGISASGPSASEAEALANAVADQLVSFVTSAGSVTSSGTVATLQAQVNQLTEQLANLQKEIKTVNARLAYEDPTSTAGRQDTNLLSEYTSEQTDLQLQLNSVKSEITETELGQVSANEGTQVIERATGASSSRTETLAITIVIGVLAGAVVGSVVVLARHRADPRLFTRDQLARALGAPVMLSLRVQVKKSAAEWEEMLERYEPSSSEQWNIRKALGEIGAVDGETPRLEVLVLDGDGPAAALAAHVAVCAAISRVPTAFVFVDEQSSMPGPRSACVRLAAVDGTPRPDLQILAREDLLPDRSAQLTVTTRVLDRQNPVQPVPRPGTVTVLAVSSGAATADQLARVAMAASDAGQPLKAVLVANPGSEDQTTGRLPDETSRAALVLHRRTLGDAAPGNRLGSGKLSLAAAIPITLASPAGYGRRG